MVEFEHTLFLLLLLVGLLNAKPPRQKWTLPLIFGGILLAFIPPARAFAVPWNLILGLVIPLILWQNIRRLLVACWIVGRYELLLWAGAALAFGVAFAPTNDLNWLGAFTFGLIAASLIWRATEGRSQTSFISQIGPLTIVFLLGEVEPQIVTPSAYLGGVFSGMFFGLVVALLAVAAYNRYTGRGRDWIILGQIYLSYWIAALFGVSAVAAAITSVIIFTTFCLCANFWRDDETYLAPLNTWGGFGALLGLFIFLGWQSHQPLTWVLLLETAIGILVAAITVAVGRRLDLPSFCELSSLQVVARVSLFLFPAFLLWPRDILQQALPLAIALGLAWFVIYVALQTLPEFLKNFTGENG